MDHICKLHLHVVILVQCEEIIICVSDGCISHFRQFERLPCVLGLDFVHGTRNQLTRCEIAQDLIFSA